VQGGGNADINFGSEIGLNVKTSDTSLNNRQSYLRFNYKDQDAAVVHDATLTLTPTAIHADQIFRIRLVEDSNDSWYEDGITWDTKPSSGGQEVNFFSNDLVLNQPYVINVTSLLNQTMNTNDIATFHIETITTQILELNTFASREHPTTQWHPVLEVNPAIAGDINGDRSVNLIDFSLLSDQWQSVGSADIAPATGDGIVNLIDLRVLSDNWLNQGPVGE
jgi:hypothetical protein